MVPISICIICKNEEQHMNQFLTSIKRHMGSYPHEIILVDTGSTDKTLSIAQEFDVKTFHFKWIGDFSAARNYSISCSSYNWILVLDCDEYITDLDPACFELMMSKYPHAVGMISRKNHYTMNKSDSIYTDSVERFFNKEFFHYRYIIHEQLCSLQNASFERISIPITTDHLGYCSSSDALESKANRNNTLLLKMLQENPNDPYLYFQLGQSYNMLHDDENACYYYGKGLEYDLDPRLEYVQMMIIGYGYALLHLGRFEEALSFEGIYNDFDFSPEFVTLMGLIYLRNGMLLQAMKEFLKATTFEVARTEGANTFIPLFNMGCVNEVLGDHESAILYYKKCGDFKPALDRLNELKENEK